MTLFAKNDLYSLNVVILIADNDCKAIQYIKRPACYVRRLSQLS